MYKVNEPHTSHMSRFMQRGLYISVGIVIGILATLCIVQRSVNTVQAQTFTPQQLNAAVKSGALKRLSSE